MPKFVIERQYLVPMFQYIVVEAETLEKDCKAAASTAPTAMQKLAEEAAEAAKSIDLDEAATRAIIDRQLRERGWEADSESLRYSQGVRPSKSRRVAIAEWPTSSGPADYAFFIDNECVAVTEAKRTRKNVSAAINQAERYAKGFTIAGVGNLIPPSVFLQETDDFGFSGVAFDGTFVRRAG